MLSNRSPESIGVSGQGGAVLLEKRTYIFVQLTAILRYSSLVSTRYWQLRLIRYLQRRRRSAALASVTHSAQFYFIFKVLFCDIIPLTQALSIHRSIFTNVFATSYSNCIIISASASLSAPSIDSTIPPRHASRSPHWARGQAICREEQHAQQLNRRFF